MSQNCDICKIINDKKHVLLLTNHWRVALSNNHAYMGRAYVTLRNHKGSLKELSHEEWLEFEGVVRQLETAYFASFGASPLNWACFMNNAYQTEPANPHVHWHVSLDIKKRRQSTVLLLKT